MIDKLRTLLYKAVYPLYRSRAPNEQREALPASWGKYDRQQRKYGIAEGEVIGLDGQTCLIKEIDGNGDMSTTVTYRDLDRDQEYTTGLVRIHQQLDRKT